MMELIPMAIGLVGVGALTIYWWRPYFRRYKKLMSENKSAQDQAWKDMEARVTQMRDQINRNAERQMRLRQDHQVRGSYKVEDEMILTLLEQHGDLFYDTDRRQFGIVGYQERMGIENATPELVRSWHRAVKQFHMAPFESGGLVHVDMTTGTRQVEYLSHEDRMKSISPAPLGPANDRPAPLIGRAGQRRMNFRSRV